MTRGAGTASTVHRIRTTRGRAGVAERRPTLHHVAIKRFLIRIEAPTWEDFEDVELPQLPVVGETIETKYGTCVVTGTDASASTAPYQGKIVCRVP
jgi:hypothetical protein